MDIKSKLWIVMAWYFTTNVATSSYTAEYAPMHFQLVMG